MHPPSLARIRATAAAVAFASFALFARAGFTDGLVGPHLSVLITDDIGSNWQIPLTSLITMDNATGDVSLDTSIPGGNGNWNWRDTSFTDRSGTTGTVKALDWQSGSTSNGTPNSGFTLYVKGNVDPYMTYSFAARNASSTTQTYTFSVGEAVVPPVSGDYHLYADIVGSVTNAFGTGTAMVSPLSGSMIQILKLSTDGGATFVNAGVDVGAMYQTSTAGGTSAYPFSSSMLDAYSALPINYWQIDTTFTLTPDKDAAAFSGYVEITPGLATIPEPSTYAALLGVSVMAFTALRRRAVKQQS